MELVFPLIPKQDIIIGEQIVDEVTESGLIVAGEAAKLRYALVHAVGPGRYYASAADARGSMEVAVFVPTTVKVGEVILFGQYQSGGEPVEIEGYRYLTFREGDIVGTLEPVRAAAMLQKWGDAQKKAKAAQEKLKAEAIERDRVAREKREAYLKATA